MGFRVLIILVVCFVLAPSTGYGETQEPQNSTEVNQEQTSKEPIVSQDNDEPPPHSDEPVPPNDDDNSTFHPKNLTAQANRGKTRFHIGFGDRCSGCCPACNCYCKKCPECPECPACPEVPKCPECPACPACPDSSPPYDCESKFIESVVDLCPKYGYMPMPNSAAFKANHSIPLDAASDSHNADIQSGHTMKTDFPETPDEDLRGTDSPSQNTPDYPDDPDYFDRVKNPHAASLPLKCPPVKCPVPAPCSNPCKPIYIPTCFHARESQKHKEPTASSDSWSVLSPNDYEVAKQIAKESIIKLKKRKGQRADHEFKRVHFAKVKPHEEGYRYYIISEVKSQIIRDGGSLVQKVKEMCNVQCDVKGNQYISNLHGYCSPYDNDVGIQKH